MKYQRDKTDLHRRLATVLMEYPLISTFNGKSGTYKAVDGEGNVYLVTWACEEDMVPYRKQRLVMDAKKFLRESEEAEVWFKPDEAWNF